MGRQNGTGPRPIAAAPEPLGAIEDGSAPLFREIVPFQIKPAGRDEFVSALTVRLKPDCAAHPRSLLLELTDEADLLFYYSLVLGEADFHTLKAEQRLLIDFQCFPQQLADLLRRCCGPSDPSGAERPGSPAEAASGSSAGSLRIAARLECGGGEGQLSLVEANQFRELTHLALRLRQGTDETVKRHLAEQLRSSRADATELADRLKVSEDAASLARRQVDELGARARVVSEERTHLERSLETTHHRELADLRQEHANAMAESQRNAAEDRARIEQELRQALDEALARASRAEKASEELQQQKQALTASGRGCQERLDASEAQLREARLEVQEDRKQIQQLELQKFQHEREIAELKVQRTSLTDHLAVKEQLLTNQATQIEQAGAQRKGLEDMLTSCRQQVHTLEEKFALSAQEIAKGNQIIQSLHTSTKQAKAKLKLKVSALAQQEKAVLDLERSEEMSKHVLEEKEHELTRGKDREQQLQDDLEDMRRKLAEALETLRANQEVIEYLNRQLTERDLKAIPQIGSLPDSHSSAPLTDLLRRYTDGGSGGLGASRAGGGIGAGSLGLGLGSLGFSRSGAGLGTGTLGTGGGLGLGLGTSSAMGITSASMPDIASGKALALDPGLGGFTMPKGADGGSAAAAAKPAGAQTPSSGTRAVAVATPAVARGATLGSPGVSPAALGNSSTGTGSGSAGSATALLGTVAYRKP